MAWICGDYDGDGPSDDYHCQLTVVKMPSMTVTKAMYEGKGCFLYPHKRHLHHSYLAYLTLFIPILTTQNCHPYPEYIRNALQSAQV